MAESDKKADVETKPKKKSATTTRRGKAKQERGDNKTYERIKVAALGLFAEKGVEPTSIRDIGAKANVPTSLLYHYAPSKYQLVYEIMSDGMERYLASATDAKSAGTLPEEKLAGVISAHIIMHCRNRQLAKVIEHGWRPLPKAEKEIILKVRDQYSRVWDEIFDAGIAEGVFTIEEPRLARLAFIQMCSISSWYSPNGPHEIEDLVQHFGELVFRAISAERGGKPIHFRDIRSVTFSDALTIVEKHHTGAVFGKKR